MCKFSEKMTNDILKSLGKENAPEKILVEAYLEVMVGRIKAEAINQSNTIEELKRKHEKIRDVLIGYGNKEFGDCIIDEICEVVGIAPTTIYYEE